MNFEIIKKCVLLLSTMYLYSTVGTAEYDYISTYTFVLILFNDKHDQKIIFIM